MATDNDAKADKSAVDQAIEQALDLFVYAPIGAALTARDEFPSFIAKGRERVTGQLTLAKMFGQFAVAQGQREAQKIGERLRQQAIDRATRMAGAASTPTRSHRPPASPSRSTSNGSQTVGAAAAADGAAAPLATAAPSRAAESDANTPPAPPAPMTTAGQTANGTVSRPAVDAPPVGDLAIPGYDTLSASHVVQRLAGLSSGELEAVRRYESATRGRRTILSKVSQLQSGPTGR